MTLKTQTELKGPERSLLKKLHLASLVEGCTLVILTCIAVPLKHLGGYPQVVTMMGPVHGLAFLFYAWMVINTASGGMWRKGQVARLLLLAFIPFGTFFNLGMITRRSAGSDTLDTSAKEKNS
ncbi:DUF3817 domain-containing protein [Sodalis sp. dw_96]|uniref:DUF3817 domain-containing protein n=1 Tax=Sodalis sp. dw_96 TaxID=2719794 RepID=UPI001BD3F4EB|nr:DUF3817 domain-containing protein [Sodalis sp. dw_96]